jgi:hypothetical protein
MTPYDVVFKAFLGKLKDFSFALLPTDVAKEDMRILMDDAILNFEYPRMSLKLKDDATEMFLNELDFDTIQLLAYLMAEAYVNRVAMDIDMMRPSMTTEEFKSFSRGGLGALTRRIEQYEKKIYSLKRAYSNRDADNKSRLNKLGGASES